VTTEMAEDIMRLVVVLFFFVLLFVVAGAAVDAVLGIFAIIGIFVVIVMFVIDLSSLLSICRLTALDSVLYRSCFASLLARAEIVLRRAAEAEKRKCCIAFVCE